MQTYFFVFAIGSFVYYAIISGYTRKWNSTFAGFWILSGSLHLILALIYPLLPVCMRHFLLFILIAWWCIFLVTEGKILCAMKQSSVQDVRYLIVLGAQVRGTKITNSLMRRLDRAWLYLIEHPETIVIVSGGQGKGELISEAEAMAENLQKRGIEPERIIRENCSVSTRENLIFSGKYIGDLTQPVALVTNNFHVYRSLLIGRQVGYTHLEGIAASSNPVLFVNYLMREFFAVLLTKIKSML